MHWKKVGIRVRVHRVKKDKISNLIDSIERKVKTREEEFEDILIAVIKLWEWMRSQKEKVNFSEYLHSREHREISTMKISLTCR